MPDSPIDGLQDEYDTLTKTIKQQLKLRDSGSDDYDWDALDRANNERNHISRKIKEAGGVPGQRPKKTNTPAGTDGGTPTDPSSPPDPSESTVGQLERKLKQVRNNPPHPGVRMEDGKVVGGTAKDLQEQLEWRGKVERLEHELTGAQAETAWAAGGGPGGFSQAERAAISKAGKKIDGIQARLDGVNKKIAGLEKKLAQAKGVLDTQKIEGGGPNAQSAAAVAVGARINADLRPLYAEQAAITKELNTALGELGTIIKAKVRAQLEESGAEVRLPNDRVGKTAVEDAFLRRVYRRLGLEYRPSGAQGLLGGLSGAQSSRLPVSPLVAITAMVVIALVAAFVVFLLLNAESNEPDTAVADAPVTADQEPPNEVVAAPDDEATDNVDNDDSVAEETPPLSPPPAATSVGIPYGCPAVQHSPLAGFTGSLSYFSLQLLVGGVGGPIPEGTMLTVDAGGIAPNSAPVIAGSAEVPIPIDHYGTYSVQSIEAVGPNGSLPVAFAIDDIIVGSSEGPVGGCVPPDDLLESGSIEVSSPSGVLAADGLWFGSEPPTADHSPDGSSSPTPDFDGFLALMSTAHSAGDSNTLLGLLDSATIERYGEAQCSQYLDDVVGSLSDLMLISAKQEPWDYRTDGAVTEVRNSWTLDIDLMLGGSPTQTMMHVRSTPEGITWFTDCGTPLQ